MYRLRIHYEMDFDNAAQRDGVFQGLGSALSNMFPTATGKKGHIEKWDEVEVQVPRAARQNKVVEEVQES